jgi:4-amino-4-deoxy-L-arabinose transferase-like glycosyltransferase
MDKKVCLLFVIIVAINLIFNGVFQLHYDEAYYWAWGQNLSLSYYDHPPMIAYMIRLTTLFYHSEFFVRLSAVITTSITILMLYKLAKKMFDQKTADITAILALSSPLMQGMFFIVTPDSPLLMFWALTLYTLYCGLFEQRVIYIYVAGFFAGCSLLSKYTGILIVPGIFLFLITSPSYRHYLAKKDLYLAFVLAIIIFSPVILWNYQHGWSSFAFQINHGVDSEFKLNWQSFGDYWGGGALVVSPIIFVAMLYYLVRYFKINLAQPKLAFLLWNYVFGLVFFAYCSLYKHTEANWPAPVYLSGIILVAHWLAINNNKWVYRSSVIFVCVVLLLGKLPLVFTPEKLHNRVPGLNIFYGNQELVQRVKPYLVPGTVLLACDYGNASRAMYYLDLPQVYVPHQLLFANEFRYLDSRFKLPIKKAIYICDSDDPFAEKIVRKYFRQLHLVEYVTYTNVMTDSKLYIYQASN